MKWPISSFPAAPPALETDRTHNDYYYSVRRSVEICQFTQQTRYLCAIPAAHNYAMSSPGSLGYFSLAALSFWLPTPAPRFASH